MVRVLLSQAELARKVGVTRAAISAAVKVGAIPVTESGKIDPQDPMVVDYAEQHKTGQRARVRLEPTEKNKKAQKKRASRRQSTADVDSWTDDGSSEVIGKLGRMSLDSISRVFGGPSELEVWLKSAKLKEDIRSSRIKNDVAEGELVSRELVATHVIGVVDEVFRRLLSDGAKSIAVQLYSFSESGIPIQKAEEEASSIMAKILERAKSRPLRVLTAKAAKKKARETNGTDGE